MQDKKLKVAVIGFGRMGINHVKAIKPQKCAEIVALVDPSIDRERVGTFFDKEPAVFSSAEALKEPILLVEKAFGGNRKYII